MGKKAEVHPGATWALLCMGCYARCSILGIMGETCLIQGFIAKARAAYVGLVSKPGSFGEAFFGHWND